MSEDEYDPWDHIDWDLDFETFEWLVHLCDLFNFLHDRCFGTASDHFALMGRDRTKATPAKAAAVHID